MSASNTSKSFPYCATILRHLGAFPLGLSHHQSRGPASWFTPVLTSHHPSSAAGRFDSSNSRSMSSFTGSDTATISSDVTSRCTEFSGSGNARQM